MTAISDLEISKFVRFYWEAVSEGALPIGSTIVKGSKSALTVVADFTGWSVSGTRRRMELARSRGLLIKSPVGLARASPKVVEIDSLPDKIIGLLQTKRQPIAKLASTIGVTIADVMNGISQLMSSGYQIDNTEDGLWFLTKKPPQIASATGGALQTFFTEADNTFTFGASSDQHLCSVHERLDVLEDLYTNFENEGIKVVLNAGNYIEGEAYFNRHELLRHGIDQQMNYLAKFYPQRDGMVTYAISGDDHEGFYSQREGVNVGKYAERTMRDNGRVDWIDLGYMEAPVKLINSNTGRESIISVVHPGGGSSYATSYLPQKYVESLSGGEKPSIIVLGHVHKLLFMNIRNVWLVVSGCTQDQTTFMRKKRIDAHIGGAIMRVKQDPATGAVTRCRCEIIRYFTRGYYANRWNHHGVITRPELDLT